MTSFTAPRPVGKFNPNEEMIALKRFSQMQAGYPVRKIPFSKLRLWWRRGYVAARNSLDPKHLAELDALYAKARLEMAKVQEVEGDSGELVAVTVEEGERGWWTVLFEDGSTKKMRKSDVETLGLLQSKEEDNG